MGEQIGIWPQGVDFRQVHLPAPQLLKGQDRTGRSGRRAQTTTALTHTYTHTHTISRPSSTRLNRPLLLPYPSLTGMWQDNRTVLALSAGATLPLWPTQALTGGQKCTLRLSAPTSSTPGANTWIPALNKRERKNDTTWSKRGGGVTWRGRGCLVFCSQMSSLIQMVSPFQYPLSSDSVMIHFISVKDILTPASSTPSPSARSPRLQFSCQHSLTLSCPDLLATACSVCGFCTFGSDASPVATHPGPTDWRWIALQLGRYI